MFLTITSIIIPIYTYTDKAIKAIFIPKGQQKSIFNLLGNGKIFHLTLSDLIVHVKL